MTMTAIPNGPFVPCLPPGWPNSPSTYSRGNFGALDADEEESQFIGRVFLAAGSGTKTFGTSSKIGVLTGGGSTQLNATATLRCGVKQASSISTTSGPPARATIGAAAFDVYQDLIGGTDTWAAVTWKNISMDTGSLSVTHGDLIAVCFHLDVTSGTQLVNFSMHNNSGNIPLMPSGTLVTAGPTYTGMTGIPNLILTFDDGTVGWLDGAFVAGSGAATANIGNTNIYGNVFQMPFDCQVDALAVILSTSTTTNFDVGLWSDPGGTPTAMTGGTRSIDPQTLGTSGGPLVVTFDAPIELTANTDYFMAVKQNSATAVTMNYIDYDTAADMAANGLDANCYGAVSTAGAAVSSLNSGKRRVAIYARLSHIDIPAGGSGGGFRVIGG